MSARSRISPREALALLRHAPTAELVARADAIRRALHGKRAYYTHSLNINPSNICEHRCDLCAFWRTPGAPDAYRLSLADIRRRLRAARGLDLTDLHIVGGINEHLGLAFYETVFRAARDVLPDVLIQGLTAVEIDSLARREGLGAAQVLRRLRAAGLGAIPGGGAEIFRGAIRRRICARKISARRWLSIHEQAHALGLPTNVTMLFGHVESAADIVDHLARVRDLQDRTGGFAAFIPLPFQAPGTRLGVARGPGGANIVRVAAVARIFLDNVPHIRALVNYMDRKLLQVLLAGGVDDVGGTSLHERIARAAGAPAEQTFASGNEIKAFLRGQGLEPHLVNSRYEERGGISRRASAWSARIAPRARALSGALAAAKAGRRLTERQAIVLHEQASLGQLGALAHARRLRRVDPRRATFVIDRNISVTNVCRAGCRFCAFHVAPGAKGSFVLSRGQVLQKVRQAVAQGATQILIQGGLNPRLDLAFYESLLTAIKTRFNVWLHSLSPAEVFDLARRGTLTIRETLRRLVRAGLDSLPGGGAEILVESVRRRVSPRKITARQWLAVMETAHSLGLKTTATMVYGLGETPAQRVAHLLAIRDLQDRTGAFTAFIPWSFQPGRTKLPRPPAGGPEYLRLVALARLVLDNVPHVQAGWVTEGPDLAQLALHFGADDFGGVLMEERVVAATGTAYRVAAGQVVSLIREAGFVPAQRDTGYRILKTFEKPCAGSTL